MAEKEDEEKSSNKNEKSEIPFLEWLTAVIGLIMVAGALGFMIYKASADGHKPPVLNITSKQPVKNDGGYLVKFEVENGGDMTAADVVIEGKLIKGEQEIETSSVTLDYAPSQSKRGGGLYFKNDPNEGNLEIIAKGYQEP